MCKSFGVKIASIMEWTLAVLEQESHTHHQTIGSVLTGKGRTQMVEKIVMFKADFGGTGGIVGETVGELVRCKDCKYYDGFGCENMKNERMIGMIVADDWFCADGERKDE